MLAKVYPVAGKLTRISLKTILRKKQLVQYAGASWGAARRAPTKDLNAKSD
jgi:hypothetical protein